MKIEVRETKITTADVNPLDVIHAFPVEWQEHLTGANAEGRGGYDAEDVLDFVKESFSECGSDIFLDLPAANTDVDHETEISIL